MRPFFLADCAGGERFCIHHAAQGTRKQGQLLYLHPFAEEMNKSRRMAALQARAMAQAGFEVLQIDLLGCGDSSGDFGDATWESWIEDALVGCRWLRQQQVPAPLWLWGLRAGCLLAAEALRHLGEPANALFVQPPTSGKFLLQQFLRLKLAAEMLEGGNKGLMAELRAALTRGEAVEIAGYTTGSALALGLEAATLVPPSSASADSRLVWLEVHTQPEAPWTPVALQAQQRWLDAGFSVDAERVLGPAFWHTTEIEEAPTLVEAICRQLLRTPEAGVAGPVPAQEASL